MFDATIALLLLVPCIAGHAVLQKPVPRRVRRREGIRNQLLDASNSARIISPVTLQ